MKSKNNGIPKIVLKGSDFFHKIPDEHDFEIIVVYKKKDLARDFVNPVESFEVVDGKLKITNRRNKYTYVYPIKDIRDAYLLPFQGD